MFKALKTCFTQSFKHMKMKALNTFLYQTYPFCCKRPCILDCNFNAKIVEHTVYNMGTENHNFCIEICPKVEMMLSAYLYACWKLENTISLNNIKKVKLTSVICMYYEDYFRNTFGRILMSKNISKVSNSCMFWVNF